MTLTNEQVVELKKQLYEQVKGLPEEQRSQANAQIESMSPESLEIMLNQQKAKSQDSKGKSETIFRMIINKEVDSIVVDENSSSLAVMDITPISKGHVLVIPKKPVSDAKNLLVSSFSLAKNISKRISSILKATQITIQTENKFGESVIHVIPSYGEEILNLESNRNKSSKEELESIAILIKPKKRNRVQKIKIEKKLVGKENSALSRQRRIP